MNDSSGCILVLVVVAFLILLAGCTAPAVPGPVAPLFTPAAEQSPAVIAVDPENATQLNEFLADFDTYAEKTRQDWNVPGMAVAIVKDGKIIFAKGYGVKTANGSDPVTTDTVFEIGSTSKAFTATLAAMEVDSGRMNWSDPVIRYVPDFQMNDPWVTKEYTITDSLAQRSGLEGYWGTDLPVIGYSRNDMIHALRYAKPVSSFRSAFSYQNLAFLVTAAAIETTSQKSWEENLRTRIFAPLSMTSATTGYDAFRAAPDHVSLHTTGVLPGNRTGPIASDPDWLFNDFTDTMGPAGGINANVKDMAAWALFNLGNGSYAGTQLVSPESMAHLHSPKTPVSDAMATSKMYYTQGWMYQEVPGSPSIIWHNGETTGNHAMVLLVPDKDVGIVVLGNVADASLPDALALVFYNRYFGRDRPDVSAEYLKQYQETQAELLAGKPVRPANATPPLALSRYTGPYTNDVYGTAMVAEVNGNLTLTYGKRAVFYNLSPWDANTFTATCPQWGPDFEGNVVFGTGADGRVRDLNMTLVFSDGKTAVFDRA